MKVLIVVVTLMLCASLDAEMLDKTASFTPTVSFSESSSDLIATVRDPLDSTIITHEQRTSQSTSATIVADITGVVLANIDMSTAFTLDFGTFSVNFTLGDIPTYGKGQTTAFYCWNGWSTAVKPVALGTGGVRLTWTSTRLTVVVTMGNEAMRPSPIASDTAIGAGPGAYRDELPVSMSFGAFAMTTLRKVYASGSASTKDVIYGPVDAPDEMFTLNFASVSGTAEFVAPVITLLSPKQGASVGAAVTLSGRATDSYGVEQVEWAIDPVNGPWTATDTLDVVSQRTDGLWGPTTKSWTVALTGIPPGTMRYYIRATDPSGNVSAPFLVTLVNPLPAILVGRWDAVLMQSVANDLRGALLITLGSNGVWTGKLTLEGASYSLTGSLDRSGSLLYAIKRTSKPDLIVKGSVAGFAPASIDAASITGTIEESSVVLANWSALRSPFSMANVLPAGFVGRFNCTIAPVTGTTGIGYHSILTTGAGAVTITSSFADGAVTTTWSGVVSAAHSLPVFIPLYAGKGSTSGTLGIDGTQHTVPAAPMRWVRPAAYADKQFSAGWNELVSVAGALYVAPTPAGTRVMGLTTAKPQIDLSWAGDGVTGTPAQRFTVGTTNLAVAVLPNGAAASVVIAPSTGLCSGSFKMLPGAVLATWRGAIIGTSLSGYYIAPVALPAVQKNYGRIDVVPVL